MELVKIFYKTIYENKEYKLINLKFKKISFEFYYCIFQKNINDNMIKKDDIIYFSGNLKKKINVDKNINFIVNSDDKNIILINDDKHILFYDASFSFIMHDSILLYITFKNVLKQKMLFDNLIETKKEIELEKENNDDKLLILYKELKEVKNELNHIYKQLEIKK